MPSHRHHRGTLLWPAAAALTGLALAGLGLTQVALATSEAPAMHRVLPLPTSAPRPSLMAGIVPTPTRTSVATERHARMESAVPSPHTVPAEPVRVRIPSIDVDSTIEATGMTDDQELRVPGDTRLVGWWRGGGKPGQSGGAAVLVGHKDSTSGPAVLYALPEVVPGDVVYVYDIKKTKRTFVVTAVERVSKNSFPTRKVYGATLAPELRVITCGGAFDEGTGHYEDNVIVYAVLKK